MPTAEGITSVIIKFDALGRPLPVYSFVRLPAVKEVLLKFVIESGYVPADQLPMLEFKGTLGQEYQIAAKLAESGTFAFRIAGEGCGGIVQMPPRISLENGKVITPDHIILQTLVSKWMGTIDEWDVHLRASATAGYNMIHFTPLQRRGLSDSPYSLYSHQEISASLFRDPALTPQDRIKLLGEKIGWMEKKLGLLSLIDVVWNHIACNSDLLAQHPEAGYTLQNSKHLKVAYDLDECILTFSKELATYGLDPSIKSEADVAQALAVFYQQVLPTVALWEYFVIDVSQAVRDLEAVFRREAATSPTFLLNCGEGDNPERAPTRLEEALMDDGEHGRFSLRMDLRLVTKYYRAQIDEYRGMKNECDRSLLLSRVLTEYRSLIDGLNYARYRQYDTKAQQILQNLSSRLTYERVAEHGPKMGPISEHSPLVSTYFTRVIHPVSGQLIAFANNGWIWNADPLHNFAEASSDAYFTRDVIVWGDCVKLRYGDEPEACPWLWNYMTEYTEQMARLFHGFRIDNCHSTPLHVAEYLLGKARAVRSELYVCAELFTGSEERDMLFVSRLGLNSLIREAMAAWDPAELARITHKYGGQPTGAPFLRAEYSYSTSTDVVETVAYSTPQALYMDCTHDNEMPAQKRTVADSLANAAIVSMCSAAIGSVRGYDDLIPAHLNIVTESRKYPIPLADGHDEMGGGLWSLRRELSRIHERVVEEQMSAIEVAQVGELLMVKKVNPHTMRGMILVARTAFKSTSEPSVPTITPIEWMTMEGFSITSLLRATIKVGDPITTKTESEEFIATIDHQVEINKAPDALESKTPGSILILQFEPNNLPSSSPLVASLNRIIGECDLYDLNILLYRCAAEENDSITPRGTYSIPGYGDLPYAGLKGFVTIIRKLELDPSEHHPLIENVKSGDWALEYIANRLDRAGHPRLQALSAALKEHFAKIFVLPAMAKPALFIKVIKTLYNAAIGAAMKKLSPSGDSLSCEFIKELALTSIQLLGEVKSTGLHPSLVEPSLSAGLPHFSTHHMRCWGRDVFISLPGLLLRTGRYSDAKRHILAFASCYYRGLIPNLLDSGRRPRYNARDATWWFMHAIQCYCRMAPDGIIILEEAIPMRFPSDIYVDYDDPSIYTRSKKLKEIVQDIMEAHARGIEFREWNAGPALDPGMQSEGFNIKIYLDSQTGFIHGGNALNCGTWMDKMGESEKVGTRGIPATPRDGAAIEIIALLASTLKWLSRDDKPTEMDGVTLADGTKLTFADWRAKLDGSFERHFYIPKDEQHDSQYSIDKSLVRTRGMYKDTVGASRVEGDYQLRPNMIIALSIAPWLFEHASVALSTAESCLMGPLGMRTLCPSDPAYHPYYDNANDSDDATVAKGFNYHQGPEWLWPLGCYLQAWMHSAVGRKGSPSTEELVKMIHKRIQPLIVHLRASEYAGLAELTNKDGEWCRDSCQTQAWSAATILDALCLLQEKPRNL